MRLKPPGISGTVRGFFRRETAQSNLIMINSILLSFIQTKNENYVPVDIDVSP